MRGILHNRSNRNPSGPRTRSSSNWVSQLSWSPKTVFRRNTKQIRANEPSACTHRFPSQTPHNRLLNSSIPNCKLAIASVIRAVFSLAMPPITLPLTGTKVTLRSLGLFPSLPFMLALLPTAAICCNAKVFRSLRIKESQHVGMLIGIQSVSPTTAPNRLMIDDYAHSECTLNHHKEVTFIILEALQNVPENREY